MIGRYLKEASEDPAAAKGVELLLLTKTREAIEELRRASQDNPENWYVWFCLGTALRGWAETRAEGIDALKRAAELENVSTEYQNTATISAIGATQKLEEDNIVLNAIKMEGTPNKTASKCKRCNLEDTTTYKFGWRNWVCLDCVHDMMREHSSR